MDIQGEWLFLMAARGGPVIMGTTGNILAVRSLEIPLRHHRLGTSLAYLSIIHALLRSQHEEAESRFHFDYR